MSTITNPANPPWMNSATISTGGTSITGTGYLNNGPYSIAATTWANTPIASAGNGVLKVTGDAEFEGKMKVNGKDLGKILASIEERLAILHPNPELEEKWENLQKLREAYVELEREIIEKEKVWSILNK